MRKLVRILISALIVLTGAGLVAYPPVSNFLYENRQRDVVQAYEEQTEEMGREELEQELSEAREYNRRLSDSRVILSDPFDPDALFGEKVPDYETLLATDENGVMGYLEIPAIGASLGIYHGTGARALESGVGHLENSSLPVGGENTHAVLSAHTGLPGKKLFTDLELLTSGDRFFISVLGETLAYEVDRIQVVEPTNVSDLAVEAGQDYVTLVTCTPYGVNSHRLLVRGRRIPREEVLELPDSVQVKEESQWMRRYFQGIFGGLALLLILLILYRIYCVRRDKGEGQC